jgi:hypothetical protein
MYDDIYKYGKMYNSSGTVVISGHASPSGTHGQNLFLAKSRAHNVSKTLGGLGTRSRAISPSWLHVRNDTRTSEVYAVVKGTPLTANQRALCRSVYVVLWLLRNVDEQERFSEQLRTRVRGFLSGRVTTSKYERIFYYWVIDNWAYLNNRSNKYLRETYPLEDGLFFKAPSTPLRNDRDALSYLRQLHGRFTAAKHRLETKYTGVPGHSAQPAGGDPVRCYQQLARWIALDGLARAGSEKVFHFISGVAIQRSMNELIEMINRGKFGDKDVVWTKVERYLQQHRIPMRCVKQPMR